MGKRKKAAKAPTKKRGEPLATTFACLFCNHENSVIVKLERKTGVGQLHCKVCGQTFQCGVNYLSAAVDVYSEWVDACDAVAKGNEAGGESVARAATDRGRPGRDRAGADSEGEDGYEGEGIVADDEEY